MHPPPTRLTLDGGVRVRATNQTLGVVDGVGRVHGRLVLGGLAKEALGIREGDVRRRRARALRHRGTKTTVQVTWLADSPASEVGQASRTWSLAMISILSFSMTATHEYVVL